MKKYRTLKSVFHQFDEQAAIQEAQRRREVGYSTGMMLGEYELFYVPTTETSLLMEKIYQNEKAHSELAQDIPGAALQSYLYTLIIDEIFSTNEIEGVRSTRQEILEALESEPQENKRFREMARLYSSLAEDREKIPQSIKEIRSLYDELLEGELEEDDKLDGKFFRQKNVFVKDGAGNTIHSGAPDEGTIVHNIQALLNHVKDEEVPSLFSSVISHFMLEATHPFYDGNGRFGRYLLSAQLKRFLSAYTVLTLSRKINEEKTKYYKAFSAVEEPKSYSDATPFLISILELIISAQEDLMDDLKVRNQQMADLRQQINIVQEQDSKTEPEIFLALFIMAQVELYGRETSISWDSLSAAMGKSRNTTRRYIKNLEDDGLIYRTSSKPLKVKLSDTARRLLFPDGESR